MVSWMMIADFKNSRIHKEDFNVSLVAKVFYNLLVISGDNIISETINIMS